MENAIKSLNQVMNIEKEELEHIVIMHKLF